MKLLHCIVLCISFRPSLTFYILLFSKGQLLVYEVCIDLMRSNSLCSLEVKVQLNIQDFFFFSFYQNESPWKDMEAF